MFCSFSKSEFPVEPDRENGRAGCFGSAHEVHECLRCYFCRAIDVFFTLSFVCYPAVGLQSWSLPQGVSGVWGMSHDICGACRQWRSGGGVCHSRRRPFYGKILTTTKYLFCISITLYYFAASLTLKWHIHRVLSLTVMFSDMVSSNVIG